jgi:hypothetical protein
VKPTVGRIVHYCKGEIMAAIITRVPDERESREGVSLTVFIPRGHNGTVLAMLENVAYSADPAEGCWSWPPRI